MFEGLDTVEELPPLPPVPEDLIDIPADVLAGWDEDGAAWWEESLLQLTPAERFRLEHGADPSPTVLRIDASQDAAAHAQDTAVQAHRVRNLADSRRIDTLLRAADQSLEDLRIRFGESFADPNGLGAKTFSRSMGLMTLSSPNLVTHEVSVARTLRDELPTCWALFLTGRLSWSRARVIVAQLDGLDEAHRPAYDAKAAALGQTSHRLKDDLRKYRERLQDDTAARRARTTFQNRRTSLELGHDGGVALVAEGLATTWVPINDAIHRAAVAAHGTDPRHRTVAQLRHDIVVDILTDGLRAYPTSENAAVPVRKPVGIQLILTVPALAWLGHSKEQAQLAGYGPIAMELAKDLAAQAKSFIRVLTHPFTGARLARTGPPTGHPPTSPAGSGSGTGGAGSPGPPPPPTSPTSTTRGNGSTTASPRTTTSSPCLAASTSPNPSASSTRNCWTPAPSAGTTPGTTTSKTRRPTRSTLHRRTSLPHQDDEDDDPPPF